MFSRLLSVFTGVFLHANIARLTTILLFVFSSVSAFAQVPDPDLDAIEEHVRRTLERDRVPGAAIAIVRRSQVLFLQGFGEDGRGRPVHEDTCFVIGSMSKAFTALVATRLIEAGRLALDSPVGATLSELSDMGGSVWHETLKAGELRERYLDRLAERKDALTQLCRSAGWQMGQHHTGESAQAALVWLYRALDGGTR